MISRCGRIYYLEKCLERVLWCLPKAVLQEAGRKPGVCYFQFVSLLSFCVFLSLERKKELDLFIMYVYSIVHIAILYKNITVVSTRRHWDYILFSLILLWKDPSKLIQISENGYTLQRVVKTLGFSHFNMNHSH